jgi:hypothetical protein
LTSWPSTYLSTALAQVPTRSAADVPQLLYLSTVRALELIRSATKPRSECLSTVPVQEPNRSAAELRSEYLSMAPAQELIRLP